MINVLISGVTGFLGSHIAEALINSGSYNVAGLRRFTSDTSRCANFSSEIHWINIDHTDWKEQANSWIPSIIIHSAWQGVGVIDRDNWKGQIKNLDLVVDLLEIAKINNVKKFIGFGSQAEYGLFSGLISEDYPLNPATAYGSSKVLVMEVIRHYCTINNLKWYWFRLFSFFGEKEDPNWFIPTAVRNIYRTEVMNMTLGDQRYAYMYVDDLAKIILAVIEKSIIPGVYNLSSQFSHSLREVIETIADILHRSVSNIKFGAIPYRVNQPMLIQGDIAKLKLQLGDIKEIPFRQSLERTIKSIISSL